MKECTERVVNVGLKRAPKKVFDEVDDITSRMVREGWRLYDSFIEESLGCIHLLFEREIPAERMPPERLR